ncbi:MAG: DUF975 family protein [Lachnospiraceae bacterium]|nr:DUF975 family protein [Lachnospiraceae bacterium]
MQIWYRANLKTKAREAVKRNYWWCVLAALIFALLCGGNGSSISDKLKERSKANENYHISINGSKISIMNMNGNDEVLDFVDAFGGKAALLGEAADFLAQMAGMAILLVAMIIVIFSWILKILVFNVLEVGAGNFFLLNVDGGQPTVKEMGYAFTNGYYGNAVVTMFMRGLKIFLWSLLFVIPGVVKAYEYRMIPYLLAENPEMSCSEAFERSREMMDGQKWDAFVLDLSFIGWHILSFFTANILSIFWVHPYQYMTNAQLYAALRDYR